MADVTVKQLAQVVGVPVDRLLNHIQKAGLEITDESQVINEDEKRILLNHLQSGAGISNPDKVTAGKITLRRKSVSQVAGFDANSGKKVNIEVRKKKVYVKPASAVEETIEETPEQDNINLEEDITTLVETVDESASKEPEQIIAEESPEEPTSSIESAVIEEEVIASEEVLTGAQEPISEAQISALTPSEEEVVKVKTDKTPRKKEQHGKQSKSEYDSNDKSDYKRSRRKDKQQIAMFQEVLVAGTNLKNARQMRNLSNI